MPNDETDDPTEAGREAESAAASPMIEVTDLSLAVATRHGSRWSRLFGRKHQVTVLDGVSFTITAGEAVGYVGAVGAAKSTIMNLIIGEVVPTGGTVRTCGLQPDAEQGELADRIGVVSGSRSQLWQDLPLDDSLQILARAHHLSDEQWAARRIELVDRLDLTTFIAMPAKKLSRGKRLRGELAAALIHEPELLILDEPATDLNVVGKEQLRSFLRQENRVHGRTLLFAADGLGDVDQICRRVLVVDHGKLIHDGDLPSLISRAGMQRTLVVDLINADRRLDDVPGATLIGVEAGGLRQRLSFIPGSIPAARVVADVAARDGIRHMTMEEPDLETLIRRL